MMVLAEINKTLFFLTAAALLSFSLSAAAEDAKPQDPPVKDATAFIAYPEDEGIQLLLDECVEIAIQNNLNLQLSRLDDRGSDYNVRIAWSQFLPTFTESLTHTNAKGVNNKGADGHGTTTLSSSVTQRTPWGTQLDFALDESRRDINQASRGGNMRVAQALWKGAGTDANLAQVRTARINRLITRANLDLDTQKLIFQVRSQYTDIIRLIQEREVTRQSVKSAQTFLKLTQAREKAGQETRLDVYQADVQLRTRELSLITNERQLETSYDRLKQIMDVDLEEKIRVVAETIQFGDKPESKNEEEVLESDDAKGVVYLSRIDEKTKKPSGDKKILFQAQLFNEQQVLSEALSNRIELLNGRRILAVQQLQTMLAKNGLGYQVDLVGTYGHTYNSSELRGTSTDTNNWSVGINAVIPWGKIADKSSYELALLALQRTEIALKQVRTTVHGDVRNILRTLREAEKSLLTEALLVEQAKRTVEATRISYERGLKDSFQLVRVEDDLLAAKNRFISRRLEYVVDLANLRMPILNIFARDDHIVPPRTSQALGERVGTKDYTELPLPGGHVGVFVSGKSQGILGDGIVRWLEAHH